VGREEHAAVERVSILVFLELALRRRYRASRFNPLKVFQSLFSWNSLFDAVIGVDVARFGSFQSLFSWNSLFDLTAA